MHESVCELTGVQLPVAGQSPLVEWRVQAGEVWLLDGAAGSGKTTLIKLLAGLIQPAAGRVSLFGTDIQHLPQRKLLRLREKLGVVLERDGLIPSWSVAENLLLPLRYRSARQRPAELERWVSGELAALGEPPALLGQRVSQLTGRQRRRVALLRILLLRPQLLLMDDLPLYLPPDEPDTEMLLARLMDGDRTLIACAPAAWASRFGALRPHRAHLGPDAFRIDRTPPATVVSDARRAMP